MTQGCPICGKTVFITPRCAWCNRSHYVCQLGHDVEDHNFTDDKVARVSALSAAPITVIAPKEIKSMGLRTPDENAEVQALSKALKDAEIDNIVRFTYVTHSGSEVNFAIPKADFLALREAIQKVEVP